MVYWRLRAFGEDNLKEIRQMTNVGLSYPNLSQWQNWLANDFDLLWCEDFNVILEFDTPLDVLKHLKYTGVTATNQKNWTRKNLNKFIDDYLQAFRLPSGKVRLTYHPLFFYRTLFSCWKLVRRIYGQGYFCIGH